MKKQIGDPSEVGQAGAGDMEITEAMIEAGSAALNDRLWKINPDAPPMNKYYRKIIVRDVFEAMALVKAPR